MNHEPGVCYCGRQAVGLGIGNPNNPTWLCQECSLMIDEIKRVRRPSAYELAARAGGMEAAGPLIEEWGSDLGEYTEEQALMLCGAIWRGTCDRLRELVRDGGAPF